MKPACSWKKRIVRHTTNLKGSTLFCDAVCGRASGCFSDRNSDNSLANQPALMPTLPLDVGLGDMLIFRGVELLLAPCLCVFEGVFMQCSTY